MNNKKLFLNLLLFLVLPTLALISLILLFSVATSALQQSESSLMVIVYYLSRTLSYALYFMWSAYFCVSLIRKKFLFSLFLALLSMILFFLRIFLSFLLSGLPYEIELLLLPSALGTLSEFGITLLISLASLAVFFCICIAKGVKSKQNFTFYPNESFALTVSFSSGAVLLLFELIREISYTVSFISAQFGVIYSSEIWSIIFDYVFLLLVFLMGCFVSLLYIRLAERALQ